MVAAQRVRVRIGMSFLLKVEQWIAAARNNHYMTTFIPRPEMPTQDRFDSARLCEFSGIGWRFITQQQSRFAIRPPLDLEAEGQRGRDDQGDGDASNAGRPAKPVEQLTEDGGTD